MARNAFPLEVNPDTAAHAWSRRGRVVAPSRAPGLRPLAALPLAL